LPNGGRPLVSLDQVTAHVLGDRDARVPEDFGATCSGMPWASINDAPE
jgi:hypothetical protein